jgi:Domain of unknown function (DUF1918)
MRAEIEVVVAGPGSQQGRRIGTIVAVQGGDGGPPYVVRWLAGRRRRR